MRAHTLMCAREWHRIPMTRTRGPGVHGATFRHTIHLKLFRRNKMNGKIHFDVGRISLDLVVHVSIMSIKFIMPAEQWQMHAASPTTQRRFATKSCNCMSITYAHKMYCINSNKNPKLTWSRRCSQDQHEMNAAQFSYIFQTVYMSETITQWPLFRCEAVQLRKMPRLVPGKSNKNWTGADRGEGERGKKLVWATKALAIARVAASVR